MSALLRFSRSPGYDLAYPGVPFGLVLVSGCRNAENPQGLDAHKRKLLRAMRRRETLKTITGRIETYARFFASFGRESPLTGHLKRTVASGFPRYNLLVDAHFMAEMCAGILVAVTDFDLFEGPLLLDVAQEGETMIGMGGLQKTTRRGEIVLRDASDIVCILCQGADQKTKVREETRNVLFYAYGVPGIGPSPIREGLEIAAETATAFGGGARTALEGC